MKNKVYETDLYIPVKEYLVSLGYRVNAEVKGVDIAATKNDELIIMELKTSFNLKLLYQVINRKKISDKVYIVIPRPRKSKSTNYSNMLHIIKCLGIGLITVALDSPLKTVEVIVCPNEDAKINNRKRREIIKETENRNFDLNMAGSVKTKLFTAFRERSIKIACIIHELGPMSARELVKTYKCEKDANRIMNQNIYGWFCKKERGIYGLSAKGIKELNEDSRFQEAIIFYKDKHFISEQFKNNT